MTLHSVMSRLISHAFLPRPAAAGAGPYISCVRFDDPREQINQLVLLGGLEHREHPRLCFQQLGTEDAGAALLPLGVM